MGTLLYSRGIPQQACLEELVVRRPDLVGAAHREYLAAGAELIETLTFGANRVRLAPAGLDISAGLLNRRAAALAREARDVAGREALVGGSMGPLESAGRGGIRQPDAVSRDAFREQLDGLLEGGIDVVVLETFVDLDELLLAIEVARQASDLPIIASLTFGEDLTLPERHRPGGGRPARGGRRRRRRRRQLRRRAAGLHRRPRADGGRARREHADAR